MYQEAYDLLTRYFHPFYLFTFSHLTQKPYLDITFFHGFAGFIALRLWEKTTCDEESSPNSSILSSLLISQSQTIAKYKKRSIDHYSAYSRSKQQSRKNPSLFSYFNTSPYAEYENIFEFDCEFLNLNLNLNLSSSFLPRKL